MKGKQIVYLILGAAFFGLMLNPLPALADYPERAITIINNQSPGGANDALVRPFAAVAEKYLKKPVVVVYKSGASGMIGNIAGVEAPPDGYTLNIGSTLMTAVIDWEILNGRKPDVQRSDFVPIGSLNWIPQVLCVPANSPWKTAADLVREVKAKPNQYTFVSGGLLASTHLGAELFVRANGLKCLHVPYKGGGPAISALVGGHGDFHCGFSLVVIPLAKGGKLRILAAMGEQRIKSLPDVPTLKELGMNVKSGMWVGIVAPKKTPTPIVEKLRDVMGKVVKDKTYIDAIQTLGEEVRYMDGNELTKFWDKESEELTQLFKEFIKEGMKVGM